MKQPWVDRSTWAATASSVHADSAVSRGIDGNLYSAFASNSNNMDWYRINLGDTVKGECKTGAFSVQVHQTFF